MKFRDGFIIIYILFCKHLNFTGIFPFCNCSNKIKNEWLQKDENCQTITLYPKFWTFVTIKHFICLKQLSINYKRQLKSIFNDPDLRIQWYFTSLSLRVSLELDKVWKYNITGERVNIGLIGGGVEVNHHDLEKNHNEMLSYNFISISRTITPSHQGIPTQIAGLMSAAANNKLCGVGAAPNSKFSNLQIFDDTNNDINDDRLSKAIVYRNQLTHIYLINLEIELTKEIKLFPDAKSIESLIEGYLSGRNKLGSIYIMGSGSQARKGSNCAFNGFAQRREILVFGAISKSGQAPVYLEKCNAVLAAAISSEGGKYDEPLFSTTINNRCENSTGNIFASNAMSAGIIALLISHNQNLTVRQIMVLLVKTSVQYDRESISNAAGLSYSYRFGYGLINALKLIRLSQNYEILNILPEHACVTNWFIGSIFKAKVGETLILFIYTSGCLESSFCVTSIEQVYAIFSISNKLRKSIFIYLTSPRGTRFNILTPRDFDLSQNGFRRWKLKLMGYFGETVIGVWKLEITSTLKMTTLTHFELIFYGTCKNSSINVNTQLKVKDFICKNIQMFSNSMFTNFMCSSAQPVFNELTKRDALSLVEVVPYIYFLNKLI